MVGVIGLALLLLVVAGAFAATPNFSSMVDRADLAPLLNEAAVKEIIKNTTESSVIMRMGRRLPDMTTRQHKLPVLSAMVEAAFRDGDTGLSKTSEARWKAKYVNAEELDVIVPIPEDVLDDTSYNAWEEIKPQVWEAFGKAFDAAVLYGVNKPSLWPTGMLQGATAAGNTVSLAACKDIYDAIMAQNGVMSKVEKQGFAVRGHIGDITVLAELRGLRDADGNPIYVANMQDASRGVIAGVNVEFPVNGCMDATDALLFSGDFKQLVYSIRKDMQWRVLTEATLMDASGAPKFNLAQQGMVALKGTMRLGWELPNPVTRLAETEATRYPFGVLLP